MTDQNDWYRAIVLARLIAANDLRVSNEILDISDALKIAAKNGELTEAKAIEIADKLIEKSLELSKSSGDLNYTVTKLVGAV